MTRKKMNLVAVADAAAGDVADALILQDGNKR